MNLKQLILENLKVPEWVDDLMDDIEILIGSKMRVTTVYNDGVFEISDESNGHIEIFIMPSKPKELIDVDINHPSVNYGNYHNYDLYALKFKVKQNKELYDSRIDSSYISQYFLVNDIGNTIMFLDPVSTKIRDILNPYLVKDVYIFGDRDLD